jgi:hypothetical protein
MGVAALKPLVPAVRARASRAPGHQADFQHEGHVGAPGHPERGPPQGSPYGPAQGLSVLQAPIARANATKKISATALCTVCMGSAFVVQVQPRRPEQRIVVAALRHQECHGGRPKLVELITNIPSISSYPVRRIVLPAPAEGEPRERKAWVALPFPAGPALHLSEPGIGNGAVAAVGIGGANGAKAECRNGGAKHDLHDLSPVGLWLGAPFSCIASSAMAGRWACAFAG